MILNEEKQELKRASKKEPEVLVRTNRVFILDTNVLLHDARAIFAFKSVVIGIPFVVLEELDTFKKEAGEKGRNAREVIRTLDELRGKGSLQGGVTLNHDTNGTILKVFPTPARVEFSTDTNAIKDNLIIQTAQQLMRDGCQVTLISKDINARVKADVLGIESEDYTKGKISYDSFYKGWINIPIPARDLRLISPNKIMSLVEDQQLYPNEFIILESENNPENNRLFRYFGGDIFKEVEPIEIMHNFSAKNIQQLMALELLMDTNVQIVTLLGPAGTGKTFLALLAGLYQVAYQKTYRKLLVTRPIVALGADIGYLPGDIQEKLHYWMQPVHDNLEFISSQLIQGGDGGFRVEVNQKKKKNHHHAEKEHHPEQKKHRFGETNLSERLQQQGILSLEAITYMRGRSIPQQFVFIDEVQNLTPHEVKTLVSRAGEGTKVILAGDPYQIDSPYLDFTSNGLTVTTEKLKEHSIFGTAFLDKSERSALAQLAAESL